MRLTLSSLCKACAPAFSKPVLHRGPFRDVNSKELQGGYWGIIILHKRAIKVALWVLIYSPSFNDLVKNCDYSGLPMNPLEVVTWHATSKSNTSGHISVQATSHLSSSLLLWLLMCLWIYRYTLLLVKNGMLSKNCGIMYATMHKVEILEKDCSLSMTDPFPRLKRHGCLCCYN